MAPSRILVVDDEESVAVTMQAILEMDGHEVMTAMSGAEAFDLIRGGSFDLVLTDLRLEDADGLQVLAEIKRRSPDTVTIILTGYASLDSAVNALREGAYDYLLKPCDVEELRATVQRGLERRRLGQQLRARVAELEQANETIGALNADLERRIEAATHELRLRVEQLKELDRLKSQFMSIASHELKTPITAMSGFLQIGLRRLRKHAQESKPLPGEQQVALLQQLEVVQRQTERLARLVDELLDVSRLQSGRIEFRLEEVDLVVLVGEVIDRMRHVSAQHQLRVSARGPIVVEADRDHVEQVLNNLVGNAIKYSPQGGAVEVTVKPSDGAALISVRDHGIGVPPEEREAIFGLFYRSPDRRARDVGGMGLGLYISKQIVDRHGGRIWADSRTGEGTTFIVELPKRAIPQAVSAAAGEVGSPV